MTDPQLSFVFSGAAGSSPAAPVEEVTHATEQDPCEDRSEAVQEPKHKIGTIYMHAVRDGDGRSLANVTSKVCACILSKLTTQPQVLYLELVGGHTAVDAILSSLNPEPRVSVSYHLEWPTDSESNPSHQKVEMPPAKRIVNTRLAIDGWRQRIQHACIASTGGDLAIVSDRRELWRYIKRNVTTPLLDKWREDLVVEMLRRDVVHRCATFGVDKTTQAYVVNPNATKIVDDIVRRYVKENVWEMIT